MPTRSEPELRALAVRLSGEWRAGLEEVRQAAERNDYSAAPDVDDRRHRVIETLADLDGLEAAYIAGEMVRACAYSSLGLYLRKAIYGEAATGGIDPRRSLRPAGIRRVG